ncbi:hypothetical protein TorRG33x02_100660 [Trema orientale]|uniref:Uncharacterized protein n=1 Tax=Trema orientale TaxID=63057 RepID=A0A2P5F8B9_TREOI|nr:hypothetical protein TorRG33x02_100660 [Trema orientale]
MTTQLLTSQPVASERLFMRIRGVLPIAPTRPCLDFLLEETKSLVLLDEEDLDFRLQRKKESTTIEAAATMAPVVLTGAIGGGC